MFPEPRLLELTFNLIGIPVKNLLNLVWQFGLF